MPASISSRQDEDEVAVRSVSVHVSLRTTAATSSSGTFLLRRDGEPRLWIFGGRDLLPGVSGLRPACCRCLLGDERGARSRGDSGWCRRCCCCVSSAFSSLLNTSSSSFVTGDLSRPFALRILAGPVLDAPGRWPTRARGRRLRPPAASTSLISLLPPTIVHGSGARARAR